MEIDRNSNNSSTGPPSKLLPGEMYNAISCDSCRVFFRRIVLIKDREPDRESLNRCTYSRIRHRDPDLNEHAVRLRCQHCRLLLCYEHGMADHYITTSEAGKKRKQAIREAQQRFEERKKQKRRRESANDAASSPSSSSSSSPSSLSMALTQQRQVAVYDEMNYIDFSKLDKCFLNNDQDHTAYQLKEFWKFYINPTNRQLVSPITTTSNPSELKYSRKFVSWMRKKQRMSSWQIAQKDDTLRSTKMYEHIRDSLKLHFQSVLFMFGFLPQLGSIGDETRHNMAIASYGELIVIRWAQATSQSNGVFLIDGMSGSNFSQENLKELGLYKGFMQYYRVTRKLKALNPDSQDLALLSALAVLTCDRGVPIPADQSALIYRLQESIGETLHRKCRIERSTRKFCQLIDILAELRETVRHVDLERLQDYKAKIVVNSQKRLENTTQ